MNKNANADKPLKCKATNIIRDFPSNFSVLWQHFLQFLLTFDTDKIRFYLDKQIHFINRLSEITISYDYRSGKPIYNNHPNF